MKPETTWTALAEAWAALPKTKEEIEARSELLFDAVAKALNDPGSFWDWFITLDVQGRTNGSLAANVLWKWTGPVPKRAYDAFVKAAIDEPCPSFNRVFVDPVLRTYGRETVVASLLARLEKAAEDEKRGIESALYWARGSTPNTPSDYERHAAMIEKHFAEKGLGKEIKPQVDRRREAATELLMNSWPNGSARVDLDPKDYYRVRFVAPDQDGPVSVGDEGIVVDHLLSDRGKKGCVVEVGPFGEHGEPRAVVVVDSSKLEALPDPVSQDEVTRVTLRQLTREAEDMGLYE